MCGLAGFLDLNGGRTAEANDHLAQAMGGAMRHRGPDAAGLWHDLERRVWFAHARLSIQDLSEAGAQPMLGPNGRSAITYNGEAYNTAQMRDDLVAEGYQFRGHSDTEVLLAGFDKWGVDAALNRFAGMFALAYLDTKRETLVLARDRVGKKPLYWAQNGGEVMFASELAPLLLHPACPRKIDRSALTDYLRWLYIPAPHSIISGVYKVEPGQIVEIDLKTRTASRRNFWTMEGAVRAGLTDPFIGDAQAAVDEADKLLIEAVRGRLVSDVPLGAFLSGGIDSSLVVAVMQEISPTPVRTFSIGSPAVEFDEGADAARIAAHLGTDHTAFKLEPADALAIIPELARIYDEPFADASQIPTYAVSKLAREHVTVALTGDGGDEVFAGYNRHVAANGLLARLNRLPRPIGRALSRAITTLSPDQWQALMQVIPASRRPRTVGDKLHKVAPLLGLSEAEQYDSLTRQWKNPQSVVIGGGTGSRAAGDPDILALLPDPASRMRYLDLIGYLPGDILTKVDRATMAVSLEARAPLLDHRLIEFSWRLPIEMHLRQGQSKWILRQLLRRRVPDLLVDRPKSGFGLPLGAWLRGPLRDWTEGLLTVERLSAGGLVNPAPVRALWERHLSGAVNAEYPLWGILMLASWQERYGHLVET